MSNIVKKKTNINKLNIKKKDKNLIYNSGHRFKKFEDIDEFKELSLNSMFKKLYDLKKIIISLKLLIHKQMKTEH